MSTALKLAMLDSRLARQAFAYGKNPFSTVGQFYNRHNKAISTAMTGIGRLRGMAMTRSKGARAARVGRARARPMRKKITNPYRSGRSEKRSNGNGFLMDTTGVVPMTVNVPTIRMIKFPVLNANSDQGRRSNNIFFSGVKICTTFYNDSPNPMEVHFALVRFIDKENPGGLSMTAAQVSTDFFRDPTGSTDREADFPNGAIVYQTGLKCWNMNSTKFNILTHKRMLLGQKATGISVKDSGYIRKIERFYRVNKRVIFENQSDALHNNPFCLLCWFTPVDPANFLVGSQEVRVETMITPYYRN